MQHYTGRYKVHEPLYCRGNICHLLPRSVYAAGESSCCAREGHEVAKRAQHTGERNGVGWIEQSGGTQLSS